MLSDFVHVSITGGSQVQLSHAFTGYVLGYSKANKVYALCCNMFVYIMVCHCPVDNNEVIMTSLPA